MIVYEALTDFSLFLIDVFVVVSDRLLHYLNMLKTDFFKMTK